MRIGKACSHWPTLRTLETPAAYAGYLEVRLVDNFIPTPRVRNAFCANAGMVKRRRAPNVGGQSMLSNYSLFFQDQINLKSGLRFMMVNHWISRNL